MRTDPVSVQAQTRSVFHPQKDAAKRGRVLMCLTVRSYEDGSSSCMTVGLYIHRSFHNARDLTRGRSDGHITLTVRTPGYGTRRQAPVNLDPPSCDG